MSNGLYFAFAFTFRFLYGGERRGRSAGERD